MKTASILKRLLIASIIAMPSLAAAQSSEPDPVAWDIYPDTWVATDGAGREMPDNSETGNYKYGQQHTVGIFYVSWHVGALYYQHSPYSADVSKILETDPDARMDGTNSLWLQDYNPFSFHWGEPESGYFLSGDPYVIRHDISMLADAGVDVLILDATNGVTYWDDWTALFDEMESMKSEGNKVPKVCFWSYNGYGDNGPIYTVQEIYDKFYAQNKYSDLWFYWYDKPLLLYNANPSLDANKSYSQQSNYLYNNSDAYYNTTTLKATQYLTDYPSYITDFFTLRNMWWGYKSWHNVTIGSEDNWNFGYDLQNMSESSYPASKLVTPHNGRNEEYAVTPAQHPSSLVGKSWTRSGGEPTLDEYDLPVAQTVNGSTVSDPESYGIYFQDRWDEALSVNPDFIYLNDWNEFTAGKQDASSASYTFMRRSSNFRFVDQYNGEFNRTIGPVKGRYTDNYYMQMAQNIRKYKGSRAIPQNYGLASSSVSANDADAWSSLNTEYRDTRSDITHRNYKGYGGNNYTDLLGRNDIVRTKVAVTSDTIYFRIETKGTLSAWDSGNWMLLFLDTDSDYSTGWNGYDYVINKTVESATLSEVTTCTADTASWSRKAYARINSTDSALLVAVSRSDLSLTSDDITFDFKIVDNPGNFASAISLATAGDAAPNRRFNYRYIWHKTRTTAATAQELLLCLIDSCKETDVVKEYVYGSKTDSISATTRNNYLTAYNTACIVAASDTTDEAYNDAYNNLVTYYNALLTAAKYYLIGPQASPAELKDGDIVIFNNATISLCSSKYPGGQGDATYNDGNYSNGEDQYLECITKNITDYAVTLTDKSHATTGKLSRTILFQLVDAGKKGPIAGSEMFYLRSVEKDAYLCLDFQNLGQHTFYFGNKDNAVAFELALAKDYCSYFTGKDENGNATTYANGITMYSYSSSTGNTAVDFSTNIADTAKTLVLMRQETVLGENYTVFLGPDWNRKKTIYTNNNDRIMWNAYTTVSKSTAWTALKELVQTVEADIDNYSPGTGIGKYETDKYSALVNALAASKAAMYDLDKSDDEYELLYSTLLSAYNALKSSLITSVFSLTGRVHPSDLQNGDIIALRNATEDSGSSQWLSSNATQKVDYTQRLSLVEAGTPDNVTRSDKLFRLVEASAKGPMLGGKMFYMQSLESGNFIRTQYTNGGEYKLSYTSDKSLAAGFEMTQAKNYCTYFTNNSSWTHTTTMADDTTLVIMHRDTSVNNNYSDYSGSDGSGSVYDMFLGPQWSTGYTFYGYWAQDVIMWNAYRAEGVNLEECEINAENFPDSNFRAYVSDSLDTDGNDTLSKAEILAATNIDVSGLGIKDLTGIEKLVAVDTLNCSDNCLTAVDLSSNTALTSLNCAGQIVEQDVYANGSNLYVISPVGISTENITNFKANGSDATPAVENDTCLVFSNSFTSSTAIFSYADNTLESYDLTYDFNTGVSDAEPMDVTVKLTAYAFPSLTECSTLCLPFNATIPDGVKAYTATLNEADETVTLTLYDGSVMPANTAFVVIGSDTAAVFNKTAENASTPAGNDLNGTLTDITLSGSTYYTLMCDESGQYAFNKSTGATLEAFRGYITSTSEAELLTVEFSGYDPTGIDDIKIGKKNGKWYTTDGIALPEQPTGKGIYIIGGKKIYK